MKKLNKKGVGIENYIIAVLAFSMVISAFLIIPARFDGFWQKYNYNLPSNSISSLSQTNNISLAVNDMVCDINPEDQNCEDDRSSIVEQTGRTIAGIITGGYGILVTISKTIGISKVMIEGSGSILGIDPLIIGFIVSSLITVLFVTITYILFNRSGDV